MKRILFQPTEIEYDLELRYPKPYWCPVSSPGERIPSGAIDGTGTQHCFSGSAFVVAIQQDDRETRVYARIYKQIT